MATKVRKFKKDEGNDETEKMIEKLEKQLNKEYKQASEEVQAKADKFMADYFVKLERKKADLQAGIITQADFDKWKEGQFYIHKRWESMANTLADDLTRTNQIASSIINGFTPDAYSLNFNFGVFQVEKGTHLDTSFTLYSRETVERLQKETPNLFPKIKTDIPKDKLWNKRHISSAITQGVLQGDDLKTISKRLQQVTDMDKNAAKRNARTAMTGAQNAGRLDSYRRMQERGIKIQKEWMATLDSYTRESHARLDGEVVDIEEKFSNGLMYPGDPDQKDKASEVYNCRCTMVASFPEYQDVDMKRYDNIAGKPIDKVTYAEWAKAHNIRKIKDDTVAVKKEYDFEGKKILYKKLNEEVKEAQVQYQKASYEKDYTRSREDFIEDTKKDFQDVSNLTEKDISEMQKKIEKLDEEIKKTEIDYDKFYNKPPRDDREAVKEWREWKRKYEEEHGMIAPEYLLKLQNEKYEYADKIRRYGYFKDDMEDAINYKTKSELVEAFNKAKEKLTKAQNALNSQFTDMDITLIDAYDKNVFFKKTDILKKKLSSEEIVKKLAGGDMTEGSCQSLALCYAGNKAGIDVTDFRGGNSQDFFADYRIPRALLNSGMKGSQETGYNQQKLAIKLLKSMEYDKEYILSGGEHASVVRRIIDESGDDKFQYLEMQSPYINGWTTLGYADSDEGTAGELKWRFGMTKSRTWQGQKLESTVFLLDVDSAKDVDNFDTLLGFMNTDPEEQQKGKKGIIR